MKILSVKNLNLIIENKDILKNIELSLDQNKILGVVGESGSGKSMLAKTILRLLSNKFQISGDIFFQENNILKI